MSEDVTPGPPAHLSSGAADLWTSIVARYELEDEELATLRLALEAFDISQTARRRLARDGQLVEDRFGQPKPHPSIQIHRDALASWSRLLGQLGIPAEGEAQDRDVHGQFGGKRARWSRG